MGKSHNNNGGPHKSAKHGNGGNSKFPKVQNAPKSQTPLVAKAPSVTGSLIGQATFSSKKGLSSLQQQFAKKLEGARFRTINETLYTTRGDEAFSSFQTDKSQFETYHIGFREQAASWPYNPLDGIINWIKANHPNKVVADMGCGDARLAASVPNTVHSFDLVSNNPRVTACDIARVPLTNKSVDIVVFCLALMGVNVCDFVKEAHRILKVNGIIRIVEVRSRFEDGREGIKKFTNFLKKAGFDITPHNSMDLNKMFFEVECVKTPRESIIDPSFTVKPCIYKRRFQEYTMKNSLFITVGTTEFDQLIEVVDSSAFFDCIRKCKFDRVRVQIGRGAYMPDKLIEYCHKSNIQCEVYRFKDTLDADMLSADLIVSHCGAGSILEAITMRKALIVVVNTTLQDNHQTELSDALTSGHYCRSTEPGQLVETLMAHHKNPLNDGMHKSFPINDYDAFPRILNEMYGFKSD